MISEVTHNRLADLKAQHAAVVAEIEAKRALALQLSSEIEATEMTIAEFTACSTPTIEVLKKVQVEARALEALRAGPLTEEELIKVLGKGRKPVHGWVLRAQRGDNPKIRRNGDERLEIVG